MATKFSQDVVPLSDMKANPGRIVRNVNEGHRPTLLTSRGTGVAIVQALDDYEHKEEEIRFMRAVAQGLADLEAGHEVTLAEAKKKLGIK